MNGELVGVWHPNRSGTPVLQYENSWLASPHARPLSLSLPFVPGNRPHKGDVVTWWFDNLLPDSREIRERLGARFGTRSLQTFDLLAAIGRECVGAVQIVPSGSDPGDIRKIDADELSQADVARVLRAVTVTPAFGWADGDEFRISIAGAQEKTALLRLGGRWHQPRGATPTNHILKLPLGLIGNVRADMTDSVENEWLCMQLLHALRFQVAATEIGRFEDERGVEKALIVSRFDRRFVVDETPRRTEWVQRLPQEDFCQATGTPAHTKYETQGGPGIPQLLQLLAAGDHPVEDRLTFAKAQLAFWLMAAPDGHAKNFSIFLTRSGYTLTPLYDVLSAWPIIGTGPNEWAYQEAELAMAIRGSRTYRKLNRVAIRHWRRLADETGVPNAFDEMVAMVEAADEALAHVESLLPPGFPEEVWVRISRGVRRHRDHFLLSLRTDRASSQLDGA